MDMIKPIPADVNRAIQDGLARCRSSSIPIVALAMFLDELRTDSQWRDADILIVEKAIRHILARIVVRQEPDLLRQNARHATC